MPYLIQIMDILIPLLATFLAAFLVAILAKVTKHLGAKYGLEIDSATDQLIATTVYKAVGYAEEWARKKVTEGATAPTGNEKLQVAILFVKQQLSGNSAAAKKVDELGGKLADQIEAYLGHTRQSSKD